MSLLAHAAVIVAIVALGWRQFSGEKPGSMIFVNDVVTGDDEGDPARPQTRSASLPPRGEARVHLPFPIPPPPPEANLRGGEGKNSGSVAGNAGGTNTVSGSGTGGAGNPILAEIRRRIEQSKRYPAQARAQHIEGKVGVQFLIQSDGRVENVRVTRSSGAPVLDEAAIQAVRHSAPLPFYGGAIDLSLAFHLR